MVPFCKLIYGTTLVITKLWLVIQEMQALRIITSWLLSQMQ